MVYLLSVPDLASLLYPGSAGKRYIAVLALHLDNSGLNGGDFCLLAGYIANTEAWDRFATQWLGLCGRHLDSDSLVLEDELGLPSVNGSPLAEATLCEFAECIVANVEMEVWSILPRFHACRIQEKHGLLYDEYRLCLDGALSNVLSDQELSHQGDPLAWVLDHYDGPNCRNVEISLFQALQDARSSESRHEHLFSSFTFADAKTLPPLQAAKFLAWEKRNSHQAGANVPIRPEFRILRDAKLKKRFNVWFDHKLEDLLIQQGFLPKQ